MVHFNWKKFVDFGRTFETDAEFYTYDKIYPTIHGEWYILNKFQYFFPEIPVFFTRFPIILGFLLYLASNYLLGISEKWPEFQLIQSLILDEITTI